MSAEALVPPSIILASQRAATKPQLRFAEDIMAPRPARTADKAPKTKKKKKGAYVKEGSEDSIKARKGRRDLGIVDEDEEYL